MRESTTTNRHTLRLGTLVFGLVESVMLAEIVWYYLHDGDQTLHDAARDWIARFRARMQWHASVDETLAMIDDLPEV